MTILGVKGQIFKFWLKFSKATFDALSDALGWFSIHWPSTKLFKKIFVSANGAKYSETCV